MDSQTLWATNIHYLNDSQEFNWALTVANGVILQRAEAASDRREKEVLTVLSHLNPQLPLPLGSWAPPVFVTSFSEEGDLLSQWRGYCPNEDGYSIGFVATALRNEARMQRFFLAPCIYDYESQCQAVEQVLDTFMTSPSWIRAIETRGQDDSNAMVFNMWRDTFALTAATLKHWGFREEREWRLISALIPLEEPRCLVRIGRSMLIPYVKFNLVGINPHIPVKEIIVGPTPHIWLATQAARSWLDSKSLQEIQIDMSKVPYRNL